MKYKPVKFNTEQHKSVAKLFYDVGKLTFAAAVLDAYVKGGISWSISLAGGCGALLFISIALKIEQEVENG